MGLDASEKLAMMRDRERVALDYNEKLKEKYGQHPKVITLHLKSYCLFSIALLLTAQP